MFYRMIFNRLKTANHFSFLPFEVILLSRCLSLGNNFFFFHFRFTIIQMMREKGKAFIVSQFFVVSSSNS